MGRRQHSIAARSVRREGDVSDAAIGAYRRLRAAIDGLKAHPAGDGGLICEYRRSRARPTLWRITSEGAVLPDNRYSFTLRSFTTAALPQGV